MSSQRRITEVGVQFCQATFSVDPAVPATREHWELASIDGRKARKVVEFADADSVLRYAQRRGARHVAFTL